MGAKNTKIKYNNKKYTLTDLRKHIYSRKSFNIEDLVEKYDKKELENMLNNEFALILNSNQVNILDNKIIILLIKLGLERDVVQQMMNERILHLERLNNEKYKSHIEQCSMYISLCNF